MQNSGAVSILFLLAMLIRKLTILRAMALCLEKSGSLLCIIVSGGYDCPSVGSGCPVAALSSEGWDQAGKGCGEPGFGLDLLLVLFPLGGLGCLLPLRRSPEVWAWRIGWMRLLPGRN